MVSTVASPHAHRVRLRRACPIGFGVGARPGAVHACLRWGVPRRLAHVPRTSVPPLLGVAAISVQRGGPTRAVMGKRARAPSASESGSSTAATRVTRVGSDLCGTGISVLATEEVLSKLQGKVALVHEFSSVKSNACEKLCEAHTAAEILIP